MSTLRTKSSNLAVFEWKVWNDLFCDGDLVQYLQIRNVHAWGISTQQSANPFVWKYIEEFENNWIAIEKSANLFGVEIYWRVWMHLRNATPSRLALYLQMWTPCVSMSLNGPLTFSHIACFVYNHKKKLRCNSFDIHVHRSCTKSFPYLYPCFIVQQDTQYVKTDVRKRK